MPIYLLSPQDLLFFGKRDDRPTADKPTSQTSAWPLPSVIFDALHGALHRSFPQVLLWEHTHPAGRNGHYANRHERLQRFGSLKTAGPFPSREVEGRPIWHLPCPTDVVVGNDGLLARVLPSREGGGTNNLPRPLKYFLPPPGSTSDRAVPAWWPKAAVESYLQGTLPLPSELATNETLFTSEPIDPQALSSSPTPGQEGGPSNQSPARRPTNGPKFPAGDYLRLQENVSLGIAATMPLQEAHDVEGLKRLFATEGKALLVGGQQRVCRVEEAASLLLNDLLPVSQPVGGDRLKWLLLSPAIFPAVSSRAESVKSHPGGWLPNWICPESGQVLLKKSDPPRAGQNRETWRRQVRASPAFDCRLVAASVPELVTVTGWSERRHLRQTDPAAVPGPKPAYAAVPAGAVYYFAGPDASLLADALSWHGHRTENAPSHKIVHRRSTLLGEKGFGLGVCGPWDF